MKMNLCSVNALVTLTTVVLLELSSTLAQRVRGDMCTGTGRVGCDSEVTNLICYEGKCRCPEALTMHSANLPSRLNTLWNTQLSKCFAVRGALCDIHPTKKRVECFPGTVCLPDPNNPEAGTCGAAQLLISWTLGTLTLCLLLGWRQT